MLFATLATLALGAQLAACGGDDENQAAPPPPDAGSDPGDAAVTGPTLTISSSRAKLYLGQTAKIDGATIAPEIVSKLAWTVVAAPSESAITNESIQQAATASPSFKPDRLGSYTLQVSGEKADGAEASVLVIVEAIDAPVFFRDLHLTGDQSSGENLTITTNTYVAGAYGTEAKAIGCPVTSASDAGAAIESQIHFVSARAGAANGDSWEGPPGTPSRVVFTELEISLEEQAMAARLTVATSSSTCGAPEAKVIDTRSTDGGVGGGGPPLLISNARFSPDGKRIAYMNDVNGGARLSTIGFDGNDKRDLSPVTAMGDGGLNPDAGTMVVPTGGFVLLGPIPPRWKDATHVGWVSFFGDEAATPDRSAWELWVVEDKPGAQAELAMRCSGSGLTHFDFLPDGTIVAAARHVVATGSGDVSPMNLLVYRANPTTKTCELVRNLTNNLTDDAVARDFALSPDKSTVAFFGGVGSGIPGNDPTDNVTLLSTVPVDGSRPPAAVPGVTGAADLGIGPRWAAGGTVITWGQTDLSSMVAGGGGGGSTPVPMSHLMSVPAEGGNTVVVADNAAGMIPSDGGFNMDVHVRYGMGQGCSSAPGLASNGAIAFGMLGAVTLLVRRRRSSTR